MIERPLIIFNVDAICKHICRNRLVVERDTGESDVHYPSLDVVSQNVANQVKTRKESVSSRVRSLSVRCDQDRKKYAVIVASSQEKRYVRTDWKSSCRG